MKFTTKQRALLKTVMRELGRQGGKASAAALTPAQRHAKAVKAGRARQAKARGDSK